MKPQFTLLLCLLFSFKPIGNEIQMKLLYKYQVKKDEKIITNENCILILYKEKSIFKSYASILNSKAYQEQLKLKVFNQSSFKKSNIKFSIEKKGKKFSYYERVAGAQLNYEGKFDASKWEITNESKVKDGKPLFKATTQYGGRNWVAWFDLAIPATDGPYIFRGLPGLIVEVHDTDFIHHFTFEGLLDEKIEEKYFEIEKKKYYQKISYKNFLEYREEAMENHYDFYNKNSPLKYPDISSEGKRKHNEKMRKNFVPIELINEK